jgi:hypothetical protein
MLLIGLSFLRIWQSLPPAAFLDTFATHAPFIGALMVPLGAAATLVTLAAAGATWRCVGSARWLALLAAAACVALGSMYPLLFSELNDRFADGSIPVADVHAALARWGSMHWVRTLLGLLAFTAQLGAIRATTAGSR